MEHPRTHHHRPRRQRRRVHRRPTLSAGRPPVLRQDQAVERRAAKALRWPRRAASTAAARNPSPRNSRSSCASGPARGKRRRSWLASSASAARPFTSSCAAHPERRDSWSRREPERSTFMRLRDQRQVSDGRRWQSQDSASRRGCSVGRNWADRTHRRGIYTSRSLLRGVFLIWWLC